LQLTLRRPFLDSNKLARRSFSHIRLGLATVSFLAAPTLAQNAPATAEPDSKAPCELHIWAAQEFGSAPWGLDELPGWDTSDLNADSDRQFIEIATAKLQIDAVIWADPVASLGLPAGTEIIAHYETEDDRPTKQRKERRSTSQAPCYYELHISYNYLIESLTPPDHFGTNFDVRHYRDGAQWETRYRARGDSRLGAFPMKEEDDPAEVARKVSVAIEANFIEYAPGAKRKLERRSRRR
jgi:hypothetical protein